MIRGVHTMFYTSEPEALRAFLRNKLGLPATAVGEGWLIFDLPEAVMGCHPADPEHGAPSGTHNISFYCDDIVKTAHAKKKEGDKKYGDQNTDGSNSIRSFDLPMRVAGATARAGLNLPSAASTQL